MNFCISRTGENYRISRIRGKKELKVYYCGSLLLDLLDYVGRPRKIKAESRPMNICLAMDLVPLENSGNFSNFLGKFT